jgi:hypothetical protein
MAAAQANEKGNVNFRKRIFKRLRYLRRVQSLFVIALLCCVAVNGFAQLIYLTDTRSVSGSASLATSLANAIPTPPYYVNSYSPFSGSAMPSAPFADFQGSASGTGTLTFALSNAVTGQLTPFSNSDDVDASQTSFLHPQELYFNSVEGGDIPGSQLSQWTAQGSSSLQVTFTVSAPTPYTLTCRGTGDPVASYLSYNLSSADQGVLVNGNTYTMLNVHEFGAPFIYTGSFDPGEVYTLTLQSQGGFTGPGPNGDGGGFIADLVVPEPSITAFAGLAFLIFFCGHIERGNQNKHRKGSPVRACSLRSHPPN